MILEVHLMKILRKVGVGGRSTKRSADWWAGRISTYFEEAIREGVRPADLVAALERTLEDLE